MQKCLHSLFWLGLAFSSAAIPQDQSKPLLGTWGFDTTALDPDTKAGDDFFRHADGAWIDRARIPPDKFAVTRRLEMTDRVDSRLHTLMDKDAASAAHQPSDLSGKVGAFYKAFMDENRIEQLGEQPINKELTDVRAATSREALAALMGRAAEDFEDTLFNVSIDIDLKDPTRYAYYVSQAGLGLPDRDYYLESSFSDKKTAYRAYVARILGLLNWPDARGQADAVVDFETHIAEASWTKVQDRDVNATYNPMSVEDLQKLAPNFDWKGFLSATQTNAKTVIVAEKSAFPKIADSFHQASIETLRAWQAFHIGDNAAPYLSKAFADAWFEMHEKALAGQAQQRVRWKRAITAVSGGDFAVGERFGTFGTLGWGVGELYTAEYFPPAAKAKVEALVNNLVSAYRARLNHLDWMSPSTKAEALKKLETYRIKVGYPDHPRDYSKLRVADDDLVGDVLRAAALDWAFLINRSRGPVDRSSWDLTPQTNDAYNGSLRDIVFPAGILQPPVFDPNADAAVNYGAVGAIIGHELTHGFDDQGRKIDAEGALRDWWSAADAQQFIARATILGNQYSAFRPLKDDPSVHVNGDLTMGENIADLGGLSLALDAYQASLGGKPAPVIDGVSGTQRVFLGWAQAWCGKVADDYVRKQVVTDPHSPRQFRVNGVVRNIDAWYAAFDVKPGDALYVAPEKRVRIW